MRIIICEDDAAFAKALCSEIKTFFDEHKIEAEITWYDNGNMLLEDFDNQKVPDLIFMDIDLGSLDGVEVIKKTRKQNQDVPVIFLTAMEGRVLDGYDVKAFYFLYKKDYADRLKSVLERYVKEYINLKRIMVKDKEGLRLFKVQEICWVEAEERSTIIHTNSGTFTDTDSISSFVKQLPEEFFIEVYHCLYVNVDYISRVDQDSLLLENGETVPVSRRKRKSVLSVVMKRLVAE